MVALIGDAAAHLTVGAALVVFRDLGGGMWWLDCLQRHPGQVSIPGLGRPIQLAGRVQLVGLSGVWSRVGLLPATCPDCGPQVVTTQLSVNR